MPKPIRIVSMGTYLPNEVSSAQLEREFGLPVGWSSKYSGVESRRQVTTECNGEMGARAADEALRNANLSLCDIDLIISAGGTFDYPIPNQGSVIKSKMKDGLLHHVPAIHIDATCLSFVVTLEMIGSLLDGKKYKRILLISAETASKGLNPKNFETLTLFGDGAAAAVVEYDEESDSSIIHSLQKTYSEGVFHTIIEGGGLKNIFKDHPYDPEMYSFQMEGIKLLKLAKRQLPSFFDDFFKDLPWKMEDVDVIIPHQASKMGLKIFNDMFHFKPNQVKETLTKYGNCIAASIPLTLSECIDKGEIKRGDTCLLTGTSAGFSIGALLLKF